jgi:hypothetical protein
VIVWQSRAPSVLRAHDPQETEEPSPEFDRVGDSQTSQTEVLKPSRRKTTTKASQPTGICVETIETIVETIETLETPVLYPI